MCFNTKKLASIIVTVAMLFSASGINAFAEKADTEVNEATEINTVEETEKEIEALGTAAKESQSDPNEYAAEADYSNEAAAVSAVADEVIIDEYNGMGSELYPYQIRTAEQFMSIGTEDSIYTRTAHYILVNDIEISSDEYVPIGNSSERFTGSFDGDGRTISFTYNGGNNQGLFGYNSGTIKNLTVSGDVTGGSCFGMLAGVNYGTIENCFTSGTVEGTSYVGGMVGQNNGTIKASGSDATVKGTSIVGGLVGKTGTILNCYALGDVSHVNGGGSEGFGGLAGGYSSYSEIIKNSYAAGEVCDGKGGGLIGTKLDSDPYIFNSYYHNVNKLNGKGFPVSVKELKDKSTYYMWDFDNVWAMDEDGYPYINLRGETPEVELEGEGTEKKPYLIEREEQLHSLAMGNAPVDEGIYYKLVNDIELTAKYWTSICMYGEFKATFDGNGHTISGIKISGINKNIGLFAKTGQNGVIKNLTVSGDVKNIDGTNIGRIADTTGILVGYNSGTIESCFSSGTADGMYAGGLVGYNYIGGTIRYCGSDAVITTTYCGGGLVGKNEGKIINSYAHGDVSGENINYAGGLVGSHASQTAYGNSNYAVVKCCYASGTVNNGDGGGLIGGSFNYGDGYTLLYNSYYHCVNTYNDAGFPATADELKDKNTYYMWDFDNIWAIDEGGYPYIDIRGEAPAVTFEGDGDADSPYLIKTERQLYALSMDEAAIGSGIHYQLANDIKLTAKNWTPIKIHSYGSKGFVGVFDGNGYTISGIRNDTIPKYNGLFGYNDGTIKNLKVSGEISSADCNNSSNGYYTALLVASNRSSGVVENCYSEGTVKGGNNVGGLVGYNLGTVKESGSAATAEGKSIVGGLVGENNGKIINSYAQGDVTATDSNGRCGGLAGGFYVSSGSGYIINCYSTGLVNNGSGYCLVGEKSSDYRNGEIYNSYTININNNEKEYVNGFVVSDEELKDKSTYYMWDFDNIWAIDEGGYPYINIRGKASAVAFEGDGDENSPYLIKTEEQLHALAMGNASVGEGIYYKLANDIELTAKYWTPIGMYSDFKASFDGNNHTISNVKTSIVNKHIGLFGYNSGTIKNLNVTGTVATPSVGDYRSNSLLVAINWENGVIESCSATGEVKGDSNLGLLVGQNYGIIRNSTASGEVTGGSSLGLLVGYNEKTIESCAANGAVTGTGGCVGGLVGEQYGGNITGSGAEATVYGNRSVGGLAGYVYSCDITDCYARGSVTAKDDNAGGLIGYIDYSDTVVSNSNSISEVIGGDEYVGGLVGYNGGKINSCFAKGTASGGSKVGGLIGRNNNRSVNLSGADVDVAGSSGTVGGLIGYNYYSTVSNSYARGNVSLSTDYDYAYGGLVGCNDNATIENCYATGGIVLSEGASKTRIGGLVGTSYGTCTVSNSYYDTETTGMSDTGSGAGMTTDEMKLAASYTDWDFADIWAISNDTNDGYPYLRALTPKFSAGDINGDKTIDNKDATYLLRYLTGWTIPGIATEALDVDGNNEVDNKDATILLRYLAGWDITLN